MSGKRNNCGTDHRFREHGIGAGLTRRICTGCGLLEIGQGRKSVLAEDPSGHRHLVDPGESRLKASSDWGR